MPATARHEVIVVGGGNAGLCAAIRARQAGASVLLLEKAQKTERGGNSSLTMNMRFSFDRRADIEALLPGEDPASIDAALAVVPNYTAAAYHDDLMTTSEGRCDPTLARVLVTGSLQTIRWLRGLGHEWEVKPNLLPGSVPVRLKGGGNRLQRRNFAVAESLGVVFLYETAATELLIGRHGGVLGVRARSPSGTVEFAAGAVILTAGGFESDPSMRAEHLGPAWGHVHMRGVPFNTGDGLRMALAAGAIRAGDWSACHAPPQDPDIPSYTLPGGHFLCQMNSRYAFQYGVTVNLDGERFFDEGETYANFIYARLGRHILAQPGGVVFQIFDGRAHQMGLIPNSYRFAQGAIEAGSLGELASGLRIQKDRFESTIARFNQAIVSGPAFQPGQLDGVRTAGIVPPKSNWALPIDRPPFFGYPVACGLTFTFGGVQIDDSARVIRCDGNPIPGLYAAGEMVGGLFYRNYAGGTGMMAGSVLGRIAGEHAAQHFRDLLSAPP